MTAEQLTLRIAVLFRGEQPETIKHAIEILAKRHRREAAPLYTSTAVPVEKVSSPHQYMSDNLPHGVVDFKVKLKL